MDRNPIIRKGLAVGIILLFVWIAYSPVINANNVDELFKIKQIESTIRTVNSPVPLFFRDELLCIVYGGIGHFHAKIYAPMDWNNVYWNITLENIKGIIFTKHFASGFIQHISYGKYTTVIIPVFGLSPGLKIHVNVTTDQGSHERTPNPEFSVFLCFAYGFDMPG
jgi:hypothetical protein